MSGSTSPTGEQIKEVYARFGLAYYFAECLHRELAIQHTFLGIHNSSHATTPRVSELIAQVSWRTLGQAIHLIAKHLPGEVAERLREALKVRNFLAHHFWYDRIHLMASVEGIEELLAELDSAAVLFQAIDDELSSATPLHCARLGISHEALEEALANVIGGEPPTPLPKPDRPKRRERIANVWKLPTPEGSILFFEAEDGYLFQLCDVGLGWAHRRPEEGLVLAQEFQAHLPAVVESRPAGAAGWDYTLKLGDSADLIVQVGARPQTHTYRVVSTD